MEAFPQNPVYAVSTSIPHFAAIEYPGPVKSIPRALKTLGGLSHVSSVFANPSDPDASHSIELNLNTRNPFSHPVPGLISQTGNVVLKVVKRKRKKPNLGEDGKVKEGVFTMEVAGIASQTVRFRGMADFQVGVNLEDPTVQISNAVRSMDVAAIQAYRFPTPTEDFTDDMYLPPPVFARYTVPQIYDYRPVSASIPSTSIRPSGEEVTRLSNMTRWKSRPVRSITSAEPTVPQGPEEELIKVTGRAHNEPVEKKLLELLEKRPVWTRTAIQNQLTSEELRILNNQKQAIQMVSYTFSDGPFRDLVIRFGYDPRKDPEARFYQHIVLRNPANIRTKVPQGKAGSTIKGKAKEFNPLSHVFDGQTSHAKVGNFQLIDISDPLTRTFIDSPSGVLSACSTDGDGWWDRDHFEQIRQVVRRKFLGLVSGVTVTDKDCEDLMGDARTVFGEGKKGGKGKGRSASVSASVSGDGSGEDGSEQEEVEGSANEAEGPAALVVGGKKRSTNKTRKMAKLPWDTREKTRGAKAKSKVETDEERSARLRKAIGLAEGVEAGPSSSGSGLGSQEAGGEGEPSGSEGGDADEIQGDASDSEEDTDMEE